MKGFHGRDIIEPLMNPSMEIFMSTYNAFIFIIPSVLISIIFTFMIKRKKNRKIKDFSTKILDLKNNLGEV